MMSFRVPMWIKQWRRRGWSLFSYSIWTHMHLLYGISVFWKHTCTNKTVPNLGASLLRLVSEWHNDSPWSEIYKITNNPFVEWTVKPWFGANLHPQPKGWPLGRFNHARDWEWMFFLAALKKWFSGSWKGAVRCSQVSLVAWPSTQPRGVVSLQFCFSFQNCIERPEAKWVSGVYTDKSPYCEVGIQHISI